MPSLGWYCISIVIIHDCVMSFVLGDATIERRERRAAGARAAQADEGWGSRLRGSGAQLGGR